MARFPYTLYVAVTYRPSTQVVLPDGYPDRRCCAHAIFANLPRCAWGGVIAALLAVAVLAAAAEPRRPGQRVPT